MLLQVNKWKLINFQRDQVILKKRAGKKTIVCYPNDNLENKNLDILLKARKHLKKKDEVIKPPR